MTGLDLMAQLIEWGAHPSRQEGEAMLAYFDALLQRERLLTVWEQGTFMALVTFFFVPVDGSVRTFYHRPRWSTPTDATTSDLIYIDKLLALHMRPALVRAIDATLMAQHPIIRLAVWFRPGRGLRPDRRVHYTPRSRLHAYHV